MASSVLVHSRKASFAIADRNVRANIQRAPHGPGRHICRKLVRKLAASLQFKGARGLHGVDGTLPRRSGSRQAGSAMSTLSFAPRSGGLIAPHLQVLLLKLAPQVNLAKEGGHSVGGANYFAARLQGT
jgi:hypothetical protein